VEIAYFGVAAETNSAAYLTDFDIEPTPAAVDLPDHALDFYRIGVAEGWVDVESVDRTGSDQTVSALETDALNEVAAVNIQKPDSAVAVECKGIPSFYRDAFGGVSPDVYQTAVGGHRDHPAGDAQGAAVSCRISGHYRGHGKEYNDANQESFHRFHRRQPPGSRYSPSEQPLHRRFRRICQYIYRRIILSA
jgi:hypothetical protein